jgi:alpha-glucosidase
VAATAQAVTAESSPGPSWWEGAVGYQVYLRSFADSDGDGIGDLPGLLGRLDHIADLGVDLVWITPFYVSPQADHGYDVADHLEVDPCYGRLADLDAVVAGLHARGLRLLLDLVPNHTSSEHPWFVDACRSRDAEHRDHYIWRDPGPHGGPPNNWVSKFGGPAWTWHEATGQYYLHTFLPEQPDLNWRTPAVHEAFEAIVRFWLERGIDGFRVDAAHLLVKHPDLSDNPLRHAIDADADPEVVYDAYEHLHDLDQPEVVDIYRRWRSIAREHDAILLGEVVLPDPGRVRRYVTSGGLDLTFDFDVLKVGWDPRAIRRTIEDALAAGGAAAWPLSSHDDPRAAERFGGGALGARRALAYLAVLCALPGTTFLLQGDELGLDHGTLGLAAQRDPLAVRNPGATGRDGSRTPVPWSPGPGLGFTSGEAWLPFPTDRVAADTVAAQREDPISSLAATRRLLRARRAFRQGSADLTWWGPDHRVVAFRRERTLVVCNTSSDTVELQLPTDLDGELGFATDDRSTRVLGRVLTLPPDATAYVR